MVILNKEKSKSIWHGKLLQSTWYQEVATTMFVASVVQLGRLKQSNIEDGNDI